MWYGERMENMSSHGPAPERSPHASFFSARFFERARTKDRGAEHALELSRMVLGALRESPGVFYEDVGAMYPMVHERILVRREDVETVMHSVLEGNNIDIDPKGTYPNVAWWNVARGSEGLKNAFLEGRAHMDGIVAVVGFEQNDTLSVIDQKDIPDEPGMFRGADGTELDRRFVASARGAVRSDDVRFVVFRFPYHQFPESEMLDSEIEGGDKNPHGKLQHIFRGILFPKSDASRMLH